MESAGVTLVKGDLTGIVRTRRLSRAPMANIKPYIPHISQAISTEFIS
jgi:cation transport ATPase